MPEWLGVVQAMPQGLKPRSLWAFNGTTKQAAEKLERNRESVEEFRSGPKGRTHSVSFTARPRSCPDTWCVFERVFPQPVKPSFPCILRPDSSRPSDKDLSPGAPGSRAFVTKRILQKPHCAGMSDPGARERYFLWTTMLYGV